MSERHSLSKRAMRGSDFEVVSVAECFSLGICRLELNKICAYS